MRFILGLLVGYCIRGKQRLLIGTLIASAIVVFIVLPAIALSLLNPSAARSLEEGLEETLTIHRLGLPELLRRSLATSNIIESVFSGWRIIARRVKRWRAGDHLQRWVASALLKVESRFRRLKGHKEMPAL